MKDLLKDIVIYFCEIFGCPEGFEDSILLGIAILFLFLLIVTYLWKGITFLIKLKNQRLLNKNLNPYFSNLDVEKYTKYYITQHSQDISPSNEEEPSPNYISLAKQKIMPLFMNKVFTEKSENKYFIVLAGAGMGKTAFMINLYLKHLNKVSNPFAKKKLDIKLFPLGASRILEKIQSISNKKNTILLLDALDEDVEALKDYDKRISNILDACNDFNIIVITCRTQFFSNEQKEPYKTGKYSFGENGQHYFRKVYLSPFNYVDIKKYINKRFKFYEINKKMNAQKVIAKSQSLLVRPMLLSHIEDLIKIKKKRLTTFYIYKVLIDKWLEREANKPGIETKFGSILSYKSLLKDFSIGLSKKMYKDREVNRLSIHYSSNFEVNGFEISQLESEFLNNKYSYIKSKSLLNRDSSGNYKFSHKSIFEYFLALNIIKNPKHINKIDFKPFDMAKSFLEDFYSSSINPPIEFHNFFFSSSPNEIDIKYFVKIKYEKVKIIKYEGIYDWRKLHLIVTSNIDCCIIYDNNLKLIYSLVLAYNQLGLDFLKWLSGILDKNKYLQNKNTKEKLLKYIEKSSISNAISGLTSLGYDLLEKRIVHYSFASKLLYFDSYLSHFKKVQEKQPDIKFYY